MEQNNLDYLVGTLSGQISSLIATVNQMAGTISNLDARLQRNERQTTALTVRMGILGLISGGVGSFLMELILKFVK